MLDAATVQIKFEVEPSALSRPGVLIVECLKGDDLALIAGILNQKQHSLLPELFKCFS
jgi:hypothetical protein